MGPIRLLQQAAYWNHIGGVTRGEQNFEPGSLLTGPSRYLGAVEARHHDVCEQQVDLRLTAQQDERGQAIGGCQNGITTLRQDIARVIEDAGIVIHDQNRFVRRVRFHARAALRSSKVQQRPHKGHFVS